ncbi:bifunctional P-loop containing nucleoside triphosphate hydrolase/Guanylate-binding protein [Babesia duncani]|uniref:Bifunctional P-loop containing nucleoside triphosphate hydrolase/Guanylate-binding protein n=1 Tax=Babesia duncani TaxID=323732 RepID=A0AAD9PNV2_9APIC|nr:bifunctional P-loop containing nucleoside triphosphate hydrolase/Guanylate-binding protein [Babesia duncani]
MGTEINEPQGDTFEFKKSGSLSFAELSSIYDATNPADDLVTSRADSDPCLPTFGYPNGPKDPLNVKNLHAQQFENAESQRFQGTHSTGDVHNPEDGSNPYLVVRKLNENGQQPSFSFGNDTRIVDVVNYYEPSLHLSNGSPCVSESSHHSSVHKRSSSASSYMRKARNAQRGHVGGDSTTSTCPRCFSPQGLGNGKEYQSDNESTLENQTPTEGLFEVPLVCAMPRLARPFLGFTKICTPRAIRLMNFTKIDGKLTCSLESAAVKLILTHVKNLKVVTVSICGDVKSGKSYLASLLVDKPVIAFKISDPKSHSFVESSEGTIWIYVAIYKDKYAYLFLDFDGFDTNPQDRSAMIQFALLLSNCVLCNVQDPPMAGICEFVQALIAASRPREALSSSIEPAGTTQWDLKKAASLYLGSKDFGDDVLQDDATPETSDGGEEPVYWQPPILNFVFRDCNNLVKCVDERVYTPETLVEQGIFDHYTNIFNCNRHDSVDFKNRMLDAFGIFTNRKYTTLPFPISCESRQGSILSLGSNFLNRNVAKNTRGALERLIANLLSRNVSMEHSSSRQDCDDFLNYPCSNSKPDLSMTSINSLSSLFLERIDDLKSTIYNDTLFHAISFGKMTGRMFIGFLKLAIGKFNSMGCVTRHDFDEMLGKVFERENGHIAHDVSVEFLKEIKRKVATKMPMDPHELLVKCLDLKHGCLAQFNCRIICDDANALDTLSQSLDGIIAKLEAKNEKLANDCANLMLEKSIKAVEMKIKMDDLYSLDDLMRDIENLTRMFTKTLKGHGSIRRNVISSMIQDLMNMYREYHPEILDVNQEARAHFEASDASSLESGSSYSASHDSQSSLGDPEAHLQDEEIDSEEQLNPGKQLGDDKQDGGDLDAEDRANEAMHHRPVVTTVIHY